MKLLEKEEIEQQATNLAKHWQVHNDKLTCQLTFKNFIEAFAFMTKIAIHAEKLNHHPSWVNTYNSVDIELSTHDAGGLTALDFKLAAIIDQQV
jgi:4a-hydroxytetrahydrobiopterin dehydratase